MNAASMLKVSVLLLFLAAAGGLVMALLRARQDRPPHWLAMAHGLLAAAGLTLLLYVAFAVGLASLMWFGLALLVVTAALGTYLNLAYHVRSRPLSVRIITVHGLIAVAALFLIALGSFGAPASVP